MDENRVGAALNERVEEDGRFRMPEHERVVQLAWCSPKSKSRISNILSSFL